MSSERGNVKRTRPQKHQNSTKFKNDLHDKSDKTKYLNQVEIKDLCPKCKAIIEWKIKYKKYKLMSGPAVCTKCHEKNIKLSYRTICPPCANSQQLCPKCGLCLPSEPSSEV
jgi:hypothetical protein